MGAKKTLIILMVLCLVPVSFASIIFNNAPLPTHFWDNNAQRFTLSTGGYSVEFAINVTYNGNEYTSKQAINYLKNNYPNVNIRAINKVFESDKIEWGWAIDKLHENNINIDSLEFYITNAQGITWSDISLSEEHGTICYDDDINDCYEDKTNITNYIINLPDGNHIKFMDNCKPVKISNRHIRIYGDAEICGDPITFPSKTMIINGTYDSGVTTSSTANSLTDTTKAWTVNELEGKTVVLMNGSHIYMSKRIMNNSANTIVSWTTWDVTNPTGMSGIKYYVCYSPDDLVVANSTMFTFDGIHLRANYFEWQIGDGTTESCFATTASFIEYNVTPVMKYAPIGNVTANSFMMFGELSNNDYYSTSFGSTYMGYATQATGGWQSSGQMFFLASQQIYMANNKDRYSAGLSNGNNGITSSSISMTLNGVNNTYLYSGVGIPGADTTNLFKRNYGFCPPQACIFTDVPGNYTSERNHYMTVRDDGYTFRSFSGYPDNNSFLVLLDAYISNNKFTLREQGGAFLGTMYVAYNTTIKLREPDSTPVNGHCTLISQDNDFSNEWTYINASINGSYSQDIASYWGNYTGAGNHDMTNRNPFWLNCTAPGYFNNNRLVNLTQDIKTFDVVMNSFFEFPYSYVRFYNEYLKVGVC